MALQLVVCVLFTIYVVLERKLRYAREDSEISAKINGSEDYISNLPDDVLSSIISCLTVKDAAKTSVLSRRWRYLYSLVPDLNFDWDTVFHQTPRQKVHQCRRYLHKFVRGVNQFLRNYSGLKIISFRIAFCFGREFACDVDGWIAFAVRFGVEKLDFCSMCSDLSLLNFSEYKHHEMFVFSWKLLCEASELKYLRLQSCIVVPDRKCQFNSLTTLYLKFVHLAHSELQDILSSCINLECLRVSACCLPNKLPICGPRRLKHLTIYHCEGVKEIELSAINLTTFEFYGTEVIRFSFAGVRKLENVVLSVQRGTSMTYAFRELPNDVPQLKTLSIDVITDRVHYIPKDVTTFSNVKEVDFFLKISNDYDLLKIVPVLTACPLLQKLCVMMTCRLSDEIIGTEELKDCLLPKLKEVEIGGFYALF